MELPLKIYGKSASQETSMLPMSAAQPVFSERWTQFLQLTTHMK